MALAELSVPPGPAPSRPVGLARAAERARPVALARTRTLPVPGPLTGLLAEGGLRRGSTVALEGGAGATALGLALGAAASAAGSWLGFVGLPSLGLEAAVELGVVLERVVVVDMPPPGPGDPSSARSRWPTVVATLLEAVDLVYVAVPGRVAGGDARRLVARARERGSVLVRLPAHDGRGGHGPPAWPVPADVRFTVAGAEWIGPAEGGAGRLEARRVEVVAGGRGAASRERRATLWLPGPDGAVGTVSPSRPNFVAASHTPCGHRDKVRRQATGVSEPAGRANQQAQRVRTLVVWVPDWPVVAAGLSLDEPVAVVSANRVVACSPAARDEGVRRGLRRREAQSRCPGLTVVAVDVDREARAFEPVAAAVETLTPRVEVLRPGTLALPTRGPSRYFGGDGALASRAAALADAALPPGAVSRTGVADGSFTAVHAARRGLVVAPGTSAAFLAPLPVAALGDHLAPVGGAELVDLFRRLGLRTLGAVAALPARDLLARFGHDGVAAHRLASGLDEHPHRLREVPPDLTVEIELDPPAERVETAAFLARTLASELGERLAALGLACTRVSIEAETEHGEALARLWRSEGGLSAAAMADRVRWQLDGWLGAGSWGDRPTGGIAVLRLVPDQVVPDDGRQLGFWGGAAAADEQAARGVARLQGLLGPDAVLVPERRGGRAPGEGVVLVPAHTRAALFAGSATASQRPRRTREAGEGATGAPPWPGRLPAPSPAVVHADPPGVEVLDGGGRPVGVTGRGLVTAEPAMVGLAGQPPLGVSAWAGPWTADERWWDPAAHRRRARIQVVLADGTAHLLTLEAGRWGEEAVYD